MSGMDDFFGELFPILGLAGRMPMTGIPADSGYAALPYAFWMQPGAGRQNGLSACGCGQCMPDVPEAQVDEEMKKRREINVLREQMRMAAEKDDYEKAIELRERLKEMEQQ